MASFDQGVHAAAHCFCADHKATRLAFECLYYRQMYVGHCARKLHLLAAAWASHIVAVLAHFRLTPYPRPPSGRHCMPLLSKGYQYATSRSKRPAEISELPTEHSARAAPSKPFGGIDLGPHSPPQGVRCRQIKHQVWEEPALPPPLRLGRL